MTNQSVRRDPRTLLNEAQLPGLSQSAVRVMQLDRDPANGPAEFAVPIEADPGLAGQVLRFVNSSYFGFSHEISNVQSAITLVGIRSIKSFVLWNAVFDMLPNPHCGGFAVKALWQDSLRRALFARAVAQQLRLPAAEDLFAAALLQDMALPLLVDRLPVEYERLLEARRTTGSPLSSLELEEFGWTHAVAGCLMARAWRLPGSLANLIQRHTQLDEMLADPTASGGELVVALSSLLPSVQDPDWPESGKLFDAYQQICGTASALDDLFQRLDEEFAEIAPSLRLSSNVDALFQRWAEAVSQSATA